MKSTSGRTVRIGRLIGWTAVAASLGFIGLQLSQHAPWQLAGAHLEGLTAAIIGGALLYGAAGFLLSSAWYQLLGADDPNASSRPHHAVYGRTQIAKYLPGNVFHLVGRQVMGRRLGHSQARLALASLLEVVLLVLVAGTLSLPILWHRLEQVPPWLVALTVSVALLVALHLARRRDLALRNLVQDAASGYSRMLRRLLVAATLYVLFFLIVAAIFWLLALSVSDAGRPAIDLVGSIPVVALAWLVGFATPGSSAGVGVREAVLIAAVHGTLGTPASGLIALALRLVTVGGDVVFCGLSMGLAPRGGWPRPIALERDSV